MNKQDLIPYFLENYYPRQEIVYRLPVSIPISEFWPDELSYRQSLAVQLPLRTSAGESFWYVPTKKLLSSGDKLSQIVRYEDTNLLEPYAHETSMIDEAFYSSAIEGASITKAKARELIQSGKEPKTKDE